MALQWRVSLAGLPAIAALACGGEVTAPPDAPPVRTLLVHQENTGRNILLRTDGTPAGSLAVGTDLLPLGASGPNGAVVALQRGARSVLVLLTLDPVARIDTVLDPIPANMLALVSFSHDAKFIGIVSFAPLRAVLVYNRADRDVDTLVVDDLSPVLPPVFSPDNERLGVIGATGLSLSFTNFSLSDPTRRDTDILGFSPLVDRPIFGWPQWTSDGVHLAVVRVASEAVDTLVAAVFDPDRPERRLRERYRAALAPVSDARPELAFTIQSTYAFSRDTEALALGANPGTGEGRHAVYLVTPDIPRVQLVRDDPSQVLVFPQFLN